MMVEYVAVGASNFPPQGNYNPTGVAAALAYHAADAPVRRYIPHPGMLA
jgi:choline dehydrogenase-like flavoprotein